MPLSPRLMAGLSNSASAGPIGCTSGRDAPERGVLDLADLRGFRGLSGFFAMQANIGRVPAEIKEPGGSYDRVQASDGRRTQWSRRPIRWCSISSNGSRAAAALFRGDRNLANVLPAPDDLGGCGRSRLCRARRGQATDSGRRHRGWREVFARPRPLPLAARPDHFRAHPSPLTHREPIATFMHPHPLCDHAPHQETPMIDLHYWSTPNGHKVTMFLEETGLKYKIFAGQHRQGRAVQAGVSGDRAEQPHSRDGRSRAEGRRQADLDLRIRRDAAVSRREDRKVFARRSLRPLRRDPVDVLADGRARADGRAEPSLPQLRRWKKSNTRSTAM